eukprot:gene10368-11478_t
MSDTLAPPRRWAWYLSRRLRSEPFVLASRRMVSVVVVENPWARINAQMPDPMARKRYKT